MTLTKNLPLLVITGKLTILTVLVNLTYIPNLRPLFDTCEADKFSMTLFLAQPIQVELTNFT